MEQISVLEQYLTKGKRAKGTEEVYPLCFTNSTGETVWIYPDRSMDQEQTPNYWTAYVHLEDDENDFYLRMAADSGELLEWKRPPDNFYTDEGYNANNLRNVVSDEQLLEVAREYIQGYLHRDQVEYVIDASDEETARVTAGTGGQVFKLTIDKNSLQISGVEITQ